MDRVLWKRTNSLRRGSSARGRRVGFWWFGALNAQSHGDGDRQEKRETIAELSTKERKEHKGSKIRAFSLCFLRSLVAFAIFAITSRVPALLGCFIRLDELNAVMMPHAMHLEFDLIANLMVEQSLGHG